MTPSTTFTAGTVVTSDWLNAVDAHVFEHSYDVKEFGAIGDDSTDDSDAIITAIAACQADKRNLKFPPGIYKITKNITLSGQPIGIIGEPDSPMQQGSTRPAVTFRWRGTTGPMFTCSSSAWSFIGFAVDNFGSASDWLEVTLGQHYLFKNLSFIPGSGHVRFSRSVIYSNGNQLGYSKFSRIHCLSHAPKFIYIDGKGSTNGITPMEMADRCVFESNTEGRMDVVYVIDENLDSLHIHDCTFNQQSNELTIVNTEDNLLNPSISQFTFKENELDTNNSGVSDRYLRLTNVLNAVIDDNICNAGGSVTGVVNLVNTTVTSFNNNYVERVAGPFFASDTLSRVYPGMNQFNVANTMGIISDSATNSGVIPLTYGTTVTILGHLARSGDVFRINVTNTTGWTLSFAHPGIGGAGHFYRGQVFGVQIRNTSGGVMGAITPAGAYFKLAGGAFPVIANGFNRTMWFMWDGANVVELFRTATDIPN